MERNSRKVIIGNVVSNKMEKTTKFKAHDENNECLIGDRVKIMETRPLSREKRWRLVEILERVK